MKKINFGFGQIVKQTPVIISRIKAMIIFIAAGSLPFAKILSLKFNCSIEDYAMWVGFVILLSKGIAIMFGINDDATTIQPSAPNDAQLQNK